MRDLRMLMYLKNLLAEEELDLLNFAGIVEQSFLELPPSFATNVELLEVANLSVVLVSYHQPNQLYTHSWNSRPLSQLNLP